ncbi:hypothetical protein ACLFMI_00790 [Pseudonocardia nantongensis]|uniref:hypothetical protein n=1 Tax=Pseudonocardia nantongensis TaxID=1181885 RepID=UPI00397D141D
MTNDDRPGAADMPGGGASRGPEHGGDDPPRDPLAESRGDDTANSAGQAEGVHRAFDASYAPEPGSDRPISEEERTGTSAVDTRPEPALGVGEHLTAGAEDLAPDRDDAEEKGRSDRPAGEANPEGSGI